MSVNDREIGATKGSDVYPGVANPTANSTQGNPLGSNFVEDPTTDSFGAGAGPNFKGHEEAAKNFSRTAGVVEGRPGIIESTRIDPLNENSNKDDGWANVTRAADSEPTVGPSGVVSNATEMASGAAKYTYGLATGDEQAKQQGREAMFGKQ